MAGDGIQAIALNCVAFKSKAQVIKIATALADIPEIQLAPPGLVEGAEGYKMSQPFERSPHELIDRVYEYREEMESEESDFNVFGKPYVDKYGKEFLLNAPLYSTRALEDDGVELRLGPELD